MRSVLPFTQIHYPESDGKPMGETDDHRDQMVRHIDLLRHFYRDQQVYVSGDCRSISIRRYRATG